MKYVFITYEVTPLKWWLYKCKRIIYRDEKSSFRLSHPTLLNCSKKNWKLREHNVSWSYRHYSFNEYDSLEELLETHLVDVL